ncbi:RsmE family RNA methyltransferase, partial [bacterium]|nr:RsmE family RNA methyltransferase [bacterium]
AAKFMFFESNKSPVKLKNIQTKLERWDKIIESAVCQSRRNHKPEIKTFNSLEELINKQEPPIYYADLETKESISNIKDKNLTIVVGPESGFSNKELTLLKEKASGFTLGPRTLRTETAAISICAKLLI